MVSSTNGLRNTDNYEIYRKVVKSLDSSDVVNVDKAAESLANKDVIKFGQKTVTTAGTREQMPAQAIPKGYVVLIKALDGNTGLIYIGDVTVDSSNGYELTKNGIVTLQLTDLDKLYIDSSIDGEGVSWIVESD